MMTAIEKLLSTAMAEVGYVEKKSRAMLDSKTANIGDKNYTKYARDLDAISGFYNNKKQGHAWCDVFTDWCFVQAFGVDKAKQLLCQTSSRTLGAGCKYSMNYYKADGQFYTDPQPGDQIFFYTSDKSNIAHTGIVYKVDDVYVYTIEGNTNPGSEIESNGGMVCEKKYAKVYKRIAGYGRHNYYSNISENPAVYIPTVLEWQKAAMADGFKPPKYFPKYGADGKWGKECEATAKKAIVKKQTIGYKYPELTKIVQKVIGLTGKDVDGKCGSATRDAIKVYQKAHGLTADGCVGLDTWKCMLNVR